MRRVWSVLAILSLTSAALAVEPNLRQPNRPVLEGLEHRIVQANGPLTPADREELAAKGLLIGRFLSNGRYFGRIAAGKTIEDARIARIETIEPSTKISPTAVREVLTGGFADLTVYFHEDTTIDEARTALLAAGAALEDPFVVAFGPTHRLQVKAAPSSMSAIAANDDVVAITGPIKFRIVSDNARTAALSHVTEVQAAPYGLSGAGVVASLFELAAAQTDHVEFGGRFSNLNVSGGTSSDARHATHVAGTIAASGVNPDAKGMAPGVTLVEVCVRVPTNGCKNNFLSDKENQLPKLGSRIDNNSWGYQLGWAQEDLWVWNFGDDYFGAYELETASPFDEISNEKNILFVHSAGNEGENPRLPDWGQHRHVDENLNTIAGKVWCYSKDGSGTDCPTSTCTGTTDPCEKTSHHPATPYDTIGFTATGKNSIAVGAAQDLGDGIGIASFSSRGPAKDGRVKPDVVTRGYAVLSTAPGNGYFTLYGTSMAAPAVTGIAALLVEQWRRTFNGADPTPAQLKALIVAGADDVGRPGPDFTFGYGLVNAKKSVDLIRDDLGQGQRIRNFSVSNNTTQEFGIVVSSPQDVRVVLQWPDPAVPISPGHWFAEKALINDLDLKVIGPTGTEYLPYALNREQFEANATTGPNRSDNTEEIEIKNAPAGTYRVVLLGTNVPEGPQAAVVVSNVRVPVCKDITESAGTYGELVTGQTVSAGLCAAGDVDLFTWTAMPGPLAVTITTGDTPIKVTLSGAVNVSSTIPANATRTISATYSGTTPAAVTMRVEAAGAVGADPAYSFTPAFKPQTGPRRRSTRH